MTKEEIVKALRYCADGESCIDCIYPNMGLPYLPCYQKDKDAADLIEAQAAEIEKLKAQVPRWIPVAERLPKLEEPVLVLDRRGNKMVRTLRCLATEEAPSFRPDGLVPQKHITHWMPLPECDRFGDYTAWSIRDEIESIPTADVVPVVRCRDCKHSYDDLGGLTCSYGVCVDCIVPPNFFCSFGERKEENDD